MNIMDQAINPDPQHKAQQDDHKKALEEIRNNHRNKVLAVFNSPEGDMLLDMWDDLFVRQAVVRPGDAEGRDAMREGRNDFIRMIRAFVQSARG